VTQQEELSSGLKEPSSQTSLKLLKQFNADLEKL
jgi:hypothetical protein